MKRFRVKYKKLDEAYGYAIVGTDCIEIDKSINGKKHLEILTHEMIHLLWPDETEEEVERKSIMMTNTLWNQKYRRIDNNNQIPLQDGSK